MAGNFVGVESACSLPDMKGVQSICSLPSMSASPLPTYFTSDQSPMLHPVPPHPQSSGGDGGARG
eukprot:2094792-Prorocentrum_lima.AAC.1